MTTGYNQIFLDKQIILNTDVDKWFGWDVTQLIDDNNRN